MGRKKGNAQTSEIPLAYSGGLPTFCSAKHFARSSRVFVVPFWELPVDFEYSMNSTNSNLSLSEDREDLRSIEFDTAPDCDREGSEDEHEENLVSVKSSNDITSCSSDTVSVCNDDEELACIDTSWIRLLVEKRPLLFHRKLQPTLKATMESPSYSIGFSTALVPQRLRRPGFHEDLEDYMPKLLNIRQTRWSVLALDSSGHFAGAIFDGPKVIVHKTFNRYTSRAKQGGSQAAFDAQGKKAKSAGSNLRRYCQQRLGEEIHELITKVWASEIASCSRVFIAVSSRMRSMLVGTTEKPYARPDSIFQLPFALPRPTFEAVRSAYMQISGVVFATEVVMQRLEGKDETPEPTRSSMQESCAALSTPLHVAAENGDEDRVIELLESGEDPTVKDSRGRVPFELCASRAVRRTFRFWSDVHLDAWDWSSAGIPRDVSESEDVGKRRSKGKQQKIPPNLKEPSIVRLMEENTDTSGARIFRKDDPKGYNGCAPSSFSSTSSKQVRRQEPKKIVAPKRLEARSVAQKQQRHATLRRLAL